MSNVILPTGNVITIPIPANDRRHRRIMDKFTHIRKVEYHIPRNIIKLASEQ